MEKNMKKSLYIYNRVTVLYTRNLHNVMNQLYFNKNRVPHALPFSWGSGQILALLVFTRDLAEGWGREDPPG